MDISIVLPAYNEAERITESLDGIAAYLARCPWKTEVIVVDDGSADDTAARIRAHALAVKLISFEKNRGKGAAVRAGALAAQGEFILMEDVDLSTPIETLDRFMREIERDAADIVIGSRSVKGAQVVKPQAPLKVALGRMGNLLIRLLAVPNVHDTQNGFKLFRAATTRTLFAMQRHDRWGFDFELLFLARKAGLRVIELPIVWRNDERSTVRGIDYLKTLTELATLRLDDWRGKYPIERV
jgi:glycosyltransferase involved in cell wall biosynthesis